MFNAKSTAAFLKGMGIGVLVGGAAVVTGKCVLKDNKKLTKGGDKIMRAIGDFVDGVGIMVK